MTAATLVEKACVKAGLCEAGSVPTTLASMGLADLNLWYRHVWDLYPHRDIRLAEAEVSVAAGSVSVALPTAIESIVSVRCSAGALLPLGDAAAADASAAWLDASGAPSRFLSLPDGVDGDNKPVRLIRLAPVPASALTLYVKGLRRFVELTGTDTVLLPRFGAALYYFVLGECYRYKGDDAGRKAAFADAATHLNAALAFERVSSESDNVQVPVESIYDC